MIREIRWNKGLGWFTKKKSFGLMKMHIIRSIIVENGIPVCCVGGSGSCTLFCRVIKARRCKTCVWDKWSRRSIWDLRSYGQYLRGSTVIIDLSKCNDLLLLVTSAFLFLLPKQDKSRNNSTYSNSYMNWCTYAFP